MANNNFIIQNGVTIGNVAANASTGTFTANSIGVGTVASGTNGEIRATGNVIAFYSDDRLKTKLSTIDNALNKIKTLSGFYYLPNETAQALGYTHGQAVGVSAQSVQAVLPEATAPAPIDPQYLTVLHDRLIPLLIEGIKELDEKLEDLKTQIK